MLLSRLSRLGSTCSKTENSNWLPSSPGVYSAPKAAQHRVTQSCGLVMSTGCPTWSTSEAGDLSSRSYTVPRSTFDPRAARILPTASHGSRASLGSRGSRSSRGDLRRSTSWRLGSGLAY